ncbi:MAG: sugar phosphate isomerase/epimerase family protein [Christensenellales bacterium]
MKLGLCASVYSDHPLEELINLAIDIGVEGVEISCKKDKTLHIDVDELISNESSVHKYLDLFRTRGLCISALSCSGNPVHPDSDVSKHYQRAFDRALILCEKFGMDKLVVFSGTPGGGPKDKTPNWITCPWPEEYLSMTEYQWDEVLVPYWTKATIRAKEYGVTKIAFEMHPGFCVYNPETLLKLRKRIGDSVGANFDPSHLMWQGVDPAHAIMELKGAIFGVHAKDVYVNRNYILRNGVNDAKHYSEVLTRAWTFRTVGYGHGEEAWKNIISALLSVGYDGFINIEHEDLFMSRKEGVVKAVKFMKEIIVTEKSEGIWWA